MVEQCMIKGRACIPCFVQTQLNRGGDKGGDQGGTPQIRIIAMVSKKLP